MDLKKIIKKNPQLSLKAIGLISYLYINHPELKNVDQFSLKSELIEGKYAIYSAFSELLEADIIIHNHERKKGKFNSEYRINPFYDVDKSPKFL